jgi:hypothetical protein
MKIWAPYTLLVSLDGGVLFELIDVALKGTDFCARDGA